MVVSTTVTSFFIANAVRTGAGGGVRGLEGNRNLNPNHASAANSKTPSPIKTQRAREERAASVFKGRVAEGTNSLTDIGTGPYDGRIEQRAAALSETRQAIAIGTLVTASNN